MNKQIIKFKKEKDNVRLTQWLQKSLTITNSLILEIRWNDGNPCFVTKAIATNRDCISNSSISFKECGIIADEAFDTIYIGILSNLGRLIKIINTVNSIESTIEVECVLEASPIIGTHKINRANAIVLRTAPVTLIFKAFKLDICSTFVSDETFENMSWSCSQPASIVIPEQIIKNISNIAGIYVIKDSIETLIFMNVDGELYITNSDNQFRYNLGRLIPDDESYASNIQKNFELYINHELLLLVLNAGGDVKLTMSTDLTSLDRLLVTDKHNNRTVISSAPSAIQ